MKISFAAVAALLALGPAVVNAQDASAGVALYNEGKYSEAAAALSSAEGAEAKAYLAASLVRQQKYADSEAPANAALAENASHPVAVAALGEALVKQRKFDAALAKLNAALEAKNDLAHAYLWRGHAYNGKSQPAQAIRDFEQFVRLAPEAPEVASVQRLLNGLR
jgi:tetratricopeptide (TPR) repeat protein